MIEQNGPSEPNSEKEPAGANPEHVHTSTSILRIVPAEHYPNTGEVFAETLYSDDLSASDAEDDDAVAALVGYDPQDFPEDIRDEILAGKPFEVTSIEVTSPDDAYITDYIEMFSLVKEH